MNVDARDADQTASPARMRCALVPAEGAPILFEHPGSVHISGRIVEDVRVMRQWEYADDSAAIAEIWADEIADALRAWGLGERG